MEDMALGVTPRERKFHHLMQHVLSLILAEIKRFHFCQQLSEWPHDRIDMAHPHPGRNPQHDDIDRHQCSHADQTGLEQQRVISG